MNQAQQKLDQKRFHCAMPELIVEYFRKLGQFQAVVEATASYEWLVRMTSLTELTSARGIDQPRSTRERAGRQSGDA